MLVLRLLGIRGTSLGTQTLPFAYRRYLALRGEAEPRLQPKVREVREALAVLERVVTLDGAAITQRMFPSLRSG
jgi:hypothetical protein